jgi:LmbE family N-acetylglucosaminyl deacetylase
MKPDALRLLCVLAHPDDEALGFGGALARYAAEGVATYLVTATGGERGWQGSPADDPGPQALGKLREAELRQAAQVLGLRGLRLLGYHDGDLARADAAEATAKIARHIRQIRPQVVLTFGPDGSTGHPDHIAICQLTTGAIVRAADAGYEPASDWPPYSVAKLYYLAETAERIAEYDAIFGDSAMTVDGVSRRVPGWPEWAITTRLDTSAYWSQVWDAIRCHRSQLPGLAALQGLPDEQHRSLWGSQQFYRAYSLAPAQPGLENDLFYSLRAPESGA